MSRVVHLETSTKSGTLHFSGHEPSKPFTSAPDFDRLAKMYRWMEWLTFGPWLWRCRTIWLPSMQTQHKALVLGDGDGRFTSRLLAENSTIHIDAIDASSTMLAELRRRAGPHAHRIRTHLADIRTFTPRDDDYDLIVSHFFLDCLTTGEITSLARRLQPHMKPGALWVISEFSVPGGWFGRFIARPIISLLYHAFGLLTGLAIRRLPDHRAALSMAGLTLKRQRRFLIGLLISELWEQPARHDLVDSTPTD